MPKKLKHGDPVEPQDINPTGAGRPPLRTANLLFPYCHFIRTRFGTVHSAFVGLPWEQYLDDDLKGKLSYNEFHRITRQVVSRPEYVEAMRLAVINYAILHRHAGELQTMLTNFRFEVPPELFEPAAKEAKLGVVIPDDLPSARGIIARRGM